MSGAREVALLLRGLGRGGQRRLVLLGLLTMLAGAAEYATLIALIDLLKSWSREGLGRVAGGTATVFAAAILAAGAIRWLLLHGTQRLAGDLGHRLLVAAQRRLLARDWLTQAADRGSTPMLTIERVEMVVHGLLLPLLQGATALVLGSAILIALLRINAGAAMGAAGLLGGLFLVATLAVRPALRRAGRRIDEATEKRIAAVQGQAGAMRELILADARGQAAEQFRGIDRDLATARATIVTASGTPRLLVETLGLLALTAMAWWLATRAGGLEPALPVLAGLALGAQRLLPLAQTLAQSATGLAAYRPALVAIADLLELPDLDPARDRPDALPFDTAVRLDRVSVIYPGQVAPALDSMTLELRRGERVALVGANGSGKSTLADVVMGLIPPTEGTVTIDGHPLGLDNLRAWQRNIAHVPQAPFLADATVARNIAFPESVPDNARVAAAARLAGIEAMVAAMPDGFATRVGERGQLLSGGQRQRLALARAFYTPAPLLVLDEATSSLDPESEQQLLVALDRLQAEGTTILLIAHRTAMLAGCTRVVRLEGGRIV